MLHARTDYNERIQDSAGLIPAHEPVFLMRGHDPHGIVALSTWIASVEVTPEHDPVVLQAARLQLARMKQWQKDRSPKEPDMPADTIVNA